MQQKLNDLGPSSVQTIIALLLGIAGGLLIYVYCVDRFQQGYLDAIYQAKPLTIIANADPLVPAGVNPLQTTPNAPSVMPSGYAPRVVDILLSSTGRADFSDNALLRTVTDKLTKGQSACLHDLSVRGLDLITCMAMMLAGAESDGRRSLMDVHRPLLAAAAGGFLMPDTGFSVANEYLTAGSYTDPQHKKATLTRMSSAWGGGNVPWQLAWKFSTDAAPTAGQVIKALNCFGLFRQCLSKEPTIGDGTGTATNGDGEDVRSAIITLQVAVLSLLRSDPDVRFHQSLLSAAIGYEQAALWVIFVWMMVLLALRSVAFITVIVRLRARRNARTRKASGTPEDGAPKSIPLEWIAERWHDSRWQFRWGAKALPAISFVGTVRGLLLALP